MPAIQSTVANLIASSSLACSTAHPSLIASSDEPNVVLAPDEVATLGVLMDRYDKLLTDMDELNVRLEELLKGECPVKPIEPDGRIDVA